MQPYGLLPARLLCPWDSSGRILPNPGTEPASLMSAALAGSSLLLVPLGKPFYLGYVSNIMENVNIFRTDTIGYEWKFSAASRSNSFGVLLI